MEIFKLGDFGVTLEQYFTVLIQPRFIQRYWNYLLEKKHPKRTSANQMQPFESYDAPMFISDLSAVLLHC